MSPSGARPPLLLTGATGFVGRRLLARLPPGEFASVRCAVRARPAVAPPGVRWVDADFPLRPVADAALDGVETVVHLAATTGKAKSAMHFAINRDATRALVDQCVRNGVRNFLFVSTIAAKFHDLRRYPYAESKRQAEAVVAGAGLAFTVVRPTLVAGRGGKAWTGLTRLARLPITPVFGDGTARVQPIHVDDLADGLLTIVREQMFAGATWELGGPEGIGIGDLLQRLRAANGRRAGLTVRLPLRAIRATLGAVESLVGPVLPLTVGQLSTFVEDGTATANPVSRYLAAHMTSLDAMIAEGA